MFRVNNDVAYQLLLTFIPSSAHCLSEDKTPTFSSHVQSRRFKRAVDELYTEAAKPEPDETKKNILHDVHKPLISLVDVESRETVGVPSQQQNSSLEERVAALEQKVASLSATLTSMEDACKSLQNQARKC